MASLCGRSGPRSGQGCIVRQLPRCREQHSRTVQMSESHAFAKVQLYEVCVLLYVLARGVGEKGQQAKATLHAKWRGGKAGVGSQ